MKISFCIPTYNHGKFLPAALDSILAQVPDGLEFEIVIVDGASTDDTPQVVAQYQRKTHAIVYRRIPANRGVDPDIAEAVATARGDYCWLVSSDDVIPQGVVRAVLNALDTRSALYIGARLDCTKDLLPLRANPVFTHSGPRVWDFANDAQLRDFLDDAVGLISLFSYISVLIFRRALWNGTPDAAAHYGSCYAHAFRLWAALASGGVVEFLGSPVVMCRMDTDHFSSRGVFRRFMLDFDGYLGIADVTLAGRQSARQAFLAAVRREHRLYSLAKFYHACADGAQRELALARLVAVGYSKRQVRLIQALASTGPLLPAAVIVRRHIRQFVGRMRYRTNASRYPEVHSMPAASRR